MSQFVVRSNGPTTRSRCYRVPVGWVAHRYVCGQRRVAYGVSEAKALMALDESVDRWERIAGLPDVHVDPVGWVAAVVAMGWEPLHPAVSDGDVLLGSSI